MSYKRCGNSECNKINSGIDECIKGLVSALNEAGYETTASCCGHGHQPTSIRFKDGRWLVIAPDLQSYKKMTKDFPDIHGEWRMDQWTT